MKRLTLQYHVSGLLHVVMDDGSEDEFGPEMFLFAFWPRCVGCGDEPVVVVDITGMTDYGKKN